MEYRDSADSNLNEHSRVTVDSGIRIWLKKLVADEGLVCKCAS